ncbi:MAG: hypothetical protein WC934_07625 [Acidithiobacillus sp.]|jgi:hypothetical protein|uniref:hypothetical protein n=1 Tax=Acidithiobacillus sp. TaxID=1872118 RepID=UPI00355D78AB
MLPTHNDVHIDQIMTNISIAYRNGMYIAEQIFPMVSVKKQSDRYYIFTKGDWFRNTAQKRAPGGRSEGSGFTLSSDTYYCEEVAEHTLLEDETRDNADSVLNYETNKTNFVTDKILLELETRIEAMCMTTGNWDNSSTPTNLWDDYDNSDPLADIETAIEAIESTSGKMANKLILANNVWKKLKHHPQLLDRMPVTGLRTATIDTLKALTGIDNIYIGSSLVNTADMGQTASYSRVWSKDVWVGHVASAPALDTPSAGYTFVWPRDGQIRGVRRWRDEDHHSDKIEAFMCYDEKVTGSDLGYVLEAVIA